MRRKLLDREGSGETERDRGSFEGKEQASEKGK